MAASLLVSGLVVTASTPAGAQQYFNGSQTTPNGAINGGGGFWESSTFSNWTDAAGSASASYNETASTITVFGASGTSTPASGGDVTVNGAVTLTSTVQFRATGDNSVYTVKGGFLVLSFGGTTFDVGTVAAGSAPSAIISAEMVGGRLTKTGAGTLLLSSFNLYNGTTVSAGTLIASTAANGFINSLGSGSVLLDGGTLKLDVDGFLGNAVTFNDNKTSSLSAGSHDVQINGVTVNPGATATFGVAGDTGILRIGNGGSADTTSAIVIAGGTLKERGSAGITSLTFNAASVTVATGAVLDFNDSGNQGIRNLQGGGSVVTGTVGGTTLDLYVDGNTSSTFGGVISGPGRVLLATTNFDPTPSTMIFNNGGFTSFGQAFGTDTPTAGNAIITNNSGGETDFNAFATAGNATVVTNNGGKTFFYDNATGGSAQFITNGTGFVDFSESIGLLSDNRILAGSIAGSGLFISAAATPS